MHTICIIRGSDQKTIKTIHHDILINYADPLLIYVKTICTQQKHGKLKIKTAPSVNSQTEFDNHDCPTQGGTPF